MDDGRKKIAKYINAQPSDLGYVMNARQETLDLFIPQTLLPISLDICPLIVPLFPFSPLLSAVTASMLCLMCAAGSLKTMFCASLSPTPW